MYSPFPNQTTHFRNLISAFKFGLQCKSLRKMDYWPGFAMKARHKKDQQN